MTRQAKESAADVAEQLRERGWVGFGEDADFGGVDLAKNVDGHRVEITVGADEDEVYASVSTVVSGICSLAFWPG